MRHIFDYKFCKDSYRYAKVFQFKDGKFLGQKKLCMPSIRLSFLFDVVYDNNSYKVGRIKKAKLNIEKF